MTLNKVYRLLLVSGMAIGAASVAQASAFQIWEQDAAAIGDYHAGGAAEANDASTEWYNAAGMTRLKHQQLSLGATGIIVSARYKGSVTSDALFPVTSSGTTNGGTANLVPNLHYVAPINDKWAFGFGVTVPFGLSTDYPSNSFAAGAATKTKVEVIDIAPSLAYQINRVVSIGVGPDAQYLDGTFDNAVQFTTNLADADTNTGNDWAWGFHAGMLFQFTPHTRLGISYRSQVVHHMKGKSEIATTPPQTNDNLKLRVTMPAYTMLSFYHDFNKRWSVMATAAYTQWSVIQNLILQNVATPTGSQTVTIPQGFRNTWNFALGAHYRPNQKWTLMGGLGFDETPVNREDRNIRLPDNDHYALAAGAKYHVTQNLAIGGGYSHIFMHTATINNTNNVGGDVVTQTGNVKGDANIIGLQLIWTIV